MNHYYVYVYLDPRKPGNFRYGDIEFDFEPFYVGKGIGSRYLSHIYVAKKTEESTHKLNKIRKIIKEENELPIIEFPFFGLDESTAFEKEIELITDIGRIDLSTGPLVNLTNGGDGLRDPSKEIREKIRQAHLGKILSEEHKEKIRQSNIHYDENNTRWTKLRKQKLSNTLKGRDITWGDKISKSLSGKKLSASHIESLSNSRIGPKNHQWKDVDIEEIRHLRFEEKLKIAEISKLMNISISTVKRKLWQLNNGK